MSANFKLKKRNGKYIVLTKLLNFKKSRNVACSIIHLRDISFDSNKRAYEPPPRGLVG